MSAKAGWYPDQKNAGGERYWDGAKWTENRRAAKETQKVARRREGWDSGACFAASFVTYVLAGIAYSLLEDDPSSALFIGGALAGLGAVFLAIAVIATGVRVGNREAQRRYGSGD